MTGTIAIGEAGAHYIGRFAPSPTGPLHFGSLLAAVASYLQARKKRGRWLLRIEDIDPPREQRGADSAIMRTLETYGFEWHGPVLFQSRSADRFRQAVSRLLVAGLAYYCICTRRILADAEPGPLGRRYPGTCRTRGHSRGAIRVLTDGGPVSFEDGLQGLQTQCLERETGDFVIRRRDGLFAYHLAVVVDDCEQAITEVVRGIDLLDSTPRQIYLQRLLGCPVPAYVHIPVAVNAAGQKLGKSTGAPGIPAEHPGRILVAALRALRLSPPDGLAAADPETIWQWATAHWTLEPLVGQRTTPAPPRYG